MRLRASSSSAVLLLLTLPLASSAEARGHPSPPAAHGGGSSSSSSSAGSRPAPSPSSPAPTSQGGGSLSAIIETLRHQAGSTRTGAGQHKPSSGSEPGFAARRPSFHRPPSSAAKPAPSTMQPSHTGSSSSGSASSSGSSGFSVPSAAPAPLLAVPPPPATPIVTHTKLGVGLYGSVPISTLRDARPAMFLLLDPNPMAAKELRLNFPQALIVGRHYVPDGDPSLADCTNGFEDHRAKGAAFADSIAPTAVALKGVVDAWVSDNEQAASDNVAALPCHAEFQTGFVEQLQNQYGIDAVAGNDATGAIEPEDYATYFSKPISEAAYFGIHAYSKPGATTLQTDDAMYYALRYRLIHDALVKAGVPLPRGGFLLTETGLYDGWRGAVQDDAMAADFEWFEQQTEQDSYVKGQTIFGLGLGSDFQPFDILGTNVTGDIGAFNAQHG